VPDLVSKADAQVRTLAAQVDDEEALPEELQDVEAPAATEAQDDEPTDDDTETETETEADDADDGDDDDDTDAGEGLGEMFG
jgi:large subunit ribosomal protein L10